jgi:hypothetical protein
LGRITNDARCTCEIKSRTSKAKAVFNKKILFTSKLDLNAILVLYSAKTSALQKADHKYLESCEMCYLKGMMKIS